MSIAKGVEQDPRLEGARAGRSRAPGRRARDAQGGGRARDLETSPHLTHPLIGARMLLEPLRRRQTPGSQQLAPLSSHGASLHPSADVGHLDPLVSNISTWFPSSSPSVPPLPGRLTRLDIRLGDANACRARDPAAYQTKHPRSEFSLPSTPPTPRLPQPETGAGTSATRPAVNEGSDSKTPIANHPRIAENYNGRNTHHPREPRFIDSCAHHPTRVRFSSSAQTSPREFTPNRSAASARSTLRRVKMESSPQNPPPYPGQPRVLQRAESRARGQARHEDPTKTIRPIGSSRIDPACTSLFPVQHGRGHRPNSTQLITTRHDTLVGCIFTIVRVAPSSPSASPWTGTRTSSSTTCPLPIREIKINEGQGQYKDKDEQHHTSERQTARQKTRYGWQKSGPYTLPSATHEK
ncbi:hypothetical protein DFH08DRAFT_827199 [Mycena albidolilacea]|uniref:Uncharacterized protein n=1 Tax=Mycena albidolilacea TaxID=1033008 RepID=A0AAD6YZS4_9AGAR|nr:hypothetical protein DFH08DRAFT_827199 [Mycena albidolilacea]